MVVIIREQMALFVGSVDCGESVTVCWQKEVVGRCNYRRRLSMYYNKLLLCGRGWMEWTDDRRDDALTPRSYPATTPNSDPTTRLRLDSPTFSCSLSRSRPPAL
jgi:hypothetical protein